METILHLATHLQEVLIREAAEVSREQGLQKRDSKLAEGRFLQAMVIACLAHPEPTLEQVAQVAADCGAAVHPQAIDERFTETAAEALKALLDRVVRHLVSAKPSNLEIFQRFSAVLIQDSTVVTLPDACEAIWPGCSGRTESGGRAAIKFQTRIDLKDGALTGPLATVGKAADARSEFQTDELLPGALEIADLGYFELDKFAWRSTQGTFWLSRYQEKTTLWTEHEEPLDLSRLLRDQSAETTVVDQPIRMGSQHRLECRLVAIRVPAEQAARRRQRMIEKARDKGRYPSNARLELCDWNVFVTNIPPELADAAAISVLARIRWQIECMFKLWKSGGGRLGVSRSRRPNRVICETLATMIGLVLQHWILITSCWHHPNRSLRKAAIAVRSHAAVIATFLHEIDSLIRVFEALERRLSVAARLNKRKRYPSSYQLLESPTIYGKSLT